MVATAAVILASALVVVTTNARGLVAGPFAGAVHEVGPAFAFFEENPGQFPPGVLFGARNSSSSSGGSG